MILYNNRSGYFCLKINQQKTTPNKRLTHLKLHIYSNIYQNSNLKNKLSQQNIKTFRKNILNILSHDGHSPNLPELSLTCNLRPENNKAIYYTETPQLGHMDTPHQLSISNINGTEETMDLSVLIQADLNNKNIIYSHIILGEPKYIPFTDSGCIPVPKDFVKLIFFGENMSDPNNNEDLDEMVSMIVDNNYIQLTLSSE